MIYVRKAAEYVPMTLQACLGKKDHFHLYYKGRINPTWRWFNAISVTEGCAEVGITQGLSRVLCNFFFYNFNLDAGLDTEAAHFNIGGV